MELCRRNLTVLREKAGFVDMDRIEKCGLGHLPEPLSTKPSDSQGKRGFVDVDTIRT